MDDPTQRLSDLFANVPAGEEVSKARQGRMHSADFVPEVDGAIDNPKDWLGRYLIPIRLVPRQWLGTALAVFKQTSRGGDHISAEVWIPTGSDINNPETLWSVWHEVGHAVDYVYTREGKIIATPHGQFSTNHIEVLRRHQEEIIGWFPHPDRAYKTKPAELWAEAVACAIMEPGKMPPDLLAAIRPELVKRNLPVAAAPGPLPVVRLGQQLEGHGWNTDETPDDRGENV